MSLGLGVVLIGDHGASLAVCIASRSRRENFTNSILIVRAVAGQVDSQNLRKALNNLFFKSLLMTSVSGIKEGTSEPLQLMIYCFHFD